MSKLKPVLKSERERLTDQLETWTIVTAEDLKQRVDEAVKKREVIRDYIDTHLKANIDYGTIAGSKPSLFKAGSEKFCSLLHLTPRFRRDYETWEMSGRKEGLFCYVCELLDERGHVVAEGRGARDLNDPATNRQANDVNATIKMAQKSAQIDAVLRLGMLSDVFTQDLEDIKAKTPKLHQTFGEKPCPDCKRPMVLKQSGSGSQFWGCTGYSEGKCRQTLPYHKNTPANESPF